MWFERFVIIATSLARSFLPSRVELLLARPATTSACSSARSACSSRCSCCSSASCRSIAMSEVKGAIARGPRRQQALEGRAPLMATHDDDHEPTDGNGRRRRRALRRPRRVRHAGRARRGRAQGPRRRLHRLRLLQPVPGARHRRGDGHQADDPAAARSSAAASPARSAASLLQWYCNAYAWTWNISGKPTWSIPANIPIAFECDDPARGLHVVLRDVDPEQAAAGLAPAVPPRAVRPRHRRRVLPRHRGEGPPVRRRRRRRKLLETPARSRSRTCYLDPDPAQKHDAEVDHRVHRRRARRSR